MKKSQLFVIGPNIYSYVVTDNKGGQMTKLWVMFSH